MTDGFHLQSHLGLVRLPLCAVVRISCEANLHDKVYCSAKATAFLVGWRRDLTFRNLTSSSNGSKPLGDGLQKLISTMLP